MRRVSSYLSCSAKVSSFVAVLGFIFLSSTFVWAQGTTTTTAQLTLSNPQVEADSRPPLFITFIPIHRGIGPSPDVNFGCSIPYPSVTDTFSSRTATWSGGISCNATVGLYGTTVLFNFNTNQTLAYGSQFNTTSSSANSYGSYSGLATGTYEVNFNVDITPPPGYTTNAGGGCSYISGGPRVHCTVGSGSFSQP